VQERMVEDFRLKKMGCGTLQGGLRVKRIQDGSSGVYHPCFYRLDRMESDVSSQGPLVRKKEREGKGE